MYRLRTILALVPLILFPLLACSGGGLTGGPHPVPREHPRLLGSARELQGLARLHAEDYGRMRRVVLENMPAGDHEMMTSAGLLYAIEQNDSAGRKALDLAMKIIEAPVRSGHVTFGHDMANCALVYDLCYPLWSQEQKDKFYKYIGETVDANTQSETHVFHNAWYGYKWWGYGLAAYATYNEYDRAKQILADLEKDYTERAAPALELSGAGGGFGEGYYIHYWEYEWLFFCEVARHCAGIDYYAAAPEFYRNRAVADMFECYPGLRENNTRRSIPMGDSGGRVRGSDRDKSLSARRILVNFFRGDSAHQAVHAFNEQTPVSGSMSQAYKDMLWRDPSVTKGDLAKFKLSHVATGPGYVYARSSWQEDATYFYFKCGDRFTAHQHLDNGQFLVYKYEELAGDGGQYYDFGNDHDVNYHLRTIAHSTILVHDPSETWPQIRAFQGRIANDGGQHHDWPHHNGAAIDTADWNRNKALYDIADLSAFEDHGDWLYTAGDFTRSYRAAKMELCTRQIVFLRPSTFVIFDRVRATKPEFKKTWLLQSMTTPERRPDGLLVETNGRGRLFVQSCLPAGAKVALVSGDDMFRYDGGDFRPEKTQGQAPDCRVEVTPAAQSKEDYFLHVLTAADSTVADVPRAVVSEQGDRVSVSLDGKTVVFTKSSLGGSIATSAGETPFAARVVQD